MTTRKDLDVDKLIQQAALTHLTDDELSQFHDGVMDPITRSRIEAHLKRCLICTRRLKMMGDAISEMEGIRRIQTPDWHKVIFPLLIAAWAASMRRSRIAISLQRFRASVATPFEKGETEDGELKWTVSEESGEIVVRFSSRNMQLDGAKFLLKAGPVEKEVTLRPVTEDQVGAEVVFTWEERSEMPPEATMSIEAFCEPCSPDDPSRDGL